MIIRALNLFLTRLARLLGVREARIRALRRRARTFFLLPRYRYRRNLRLVNDALGRTRFADRYWITFGLLLGWARDRRPIPWDFRDADFAFADSDQELFPKVAVPALLAAGFELLAERTNNAGVTTEYVFYKDKARFEFWVMFADEEGIHYFNYGERRGIECEMLCRLPAHGVEPIDYLGRTWLKPCSHEEYLARVYGDWRVPKPDYDYAEDDENVVEAYAYDAGNSDTPRDDQ